MPSVFLNDEEVIDLILERPYLIQQVFDKLLKDIDEYQDLLGLLRRRNNQLRRRIEELEKPVDAS